MLFPAMGNSVNVLDSTKEGLPQDHIVATSAGWTSQADIQTLGLHKQAGLLRRSEVSPCC